MIDEHSDFRAPSDRYLRSFGIADGPAIFAVAYLLLVQGGFLLTLFRNFFVSAPGYDLDGKIPLFLGIAGIALTLASAAWQVLRLKRRLQASHALERSATHRTFTDIRALLSELLRRSHTRREIELFYHATNEHALHVTERSGQADRIVVGLSRATAAKEQPRLIEAMLAHEISHLERRQTRFETGARLALLLYVRVSAGFLALVVILAAYLVPAVEDGVSIASLIPSADPAILKRFVLPIALYVLITVTVITFAYFILIRRELLHDIRSLQLARNTQLLAGRFEPQCAAQRGKSWQQRLLEMWRDVSSLHPSSCQRARSLRRRDWIMLDVTLFPLMAGVLVSTPLVIAGPIAEAFSLSRLQQNLMATAIGGLLVYAVTRADTGRFAALRIERKRWWLSLLSYCALMACASMLVGAVLVLRFAAERVGWSAALGAVAEAQLPRLLHWMLFLGGLMVVSSYFVAVARLGSPAVDSTSRHRWGGELGIATLTVLAFAGKSLPPGATSVAMFAVLILATLGCAIVIAFRCRCTRCDTRRWEILALRIACSSCAHHTKVVPSFAMITPQKAENAQ